VLGVIMKTFVIHPSARASRRVRPDIRASGLRKIHDTCGQVGWSQTKQDQAGRHDRNPSARVGTDARHRDPQGVRLRVPPPYLYPQGEIPVDFAGPMDEDGGAQRALRMFIEFKREIARRVAAGGQDQP